MKGIARSHGKSQRQAKPLTAVALAAIRATANTRRPLGDGKKQESAQRASWRGRVDLALLSVLRDGLLRRSEAHYLTWADVDFRNNGTALLQLRRSKTDQEGEGVVSRVNYSCRNRPAGLIVVDHHSPDLPALGAAWGAGTHLGVIDRGV